MSSHSPKTQSGFDPLFEAPNVVEQKHLDELHISINVEEV